MSDKVFLTGISGWIAKHTAIELLNLDFEVLGTVRNKNLIEQTKDTISKYAPIDKLSFVELDLLKDDGWDKAIKNCKYVMHIASPFPMKVSNDREKLLPVAVDGTLRVLKSSIKNSKAFIRYPNSNETLIIKLSNMSFRNVGNGNSKKNKNFQHYKDILKLIMGDIYFRIPDTDLRKFLKEKYKIK